MSAEDEDREPARRIAEALNAQRGGWNAAMELRFVRASRDEVAAELRVGERHLQPYGVVHGGVYAGIVETVASTGAAIDAMSHGSSVVGLENHTSFLRATREGLLRVTARPLARGRRTQVWEATVEDERGRVVAKGTVRLIVLPPDTALAGEPVAIKPSTDPSE